jgi:hypothetical protein
MRQKITEILTEFQQGAMALNDAEEKIMDLLGLSRSSVLNGGDDLSEYGQRHKEDAETIKAVLIKKGYINAGLNDAISLWSEYSDSYAAGWLGLPEDNEEEIWNSIKDYIRTTHYID